MRELKFKKIDAFTGGLSSGNPAGCIYLNDDNLTNKEMQSIARELKGFVNETAFILPAESSGEELYSLRYYSSECEVDFCGHATIACMYDLFKNDKELISMPYVIIRTKLSALKIYNDIQNSDSVYITAPAPSSPESALSRSEVCRSLNLQETADDYGIDIIGCGLSTLIVPVKSLKGCINLKPDYLTLQNFCTCRGIDIVLVFTDDVSGTENGYRTRVFAPKFGYLEDPATGSGNSAFGHYLLKNSLWDGDNLSIEQGPDRDNPNIVRLKTAMSDNEKRVLFGGGATVKIEGRYFLHSRTL